jgi:hypothetical protein
VRADLLSYAEWVLVMIPSQIFFLESLTTTDLLILRYLLSY